MNNLHYSFLLFFLVTFNVFSLPWKQIINWRNLKSQQSILNNTVLQHAKDLFTAKAQAQQAYMLKVAIISTDLYYLGENERASLEEKLGIKMAPQEPIVRVKDKERKDSFIPFSLIADKRDGDIFTLYFEGKPVSVMCDQWATVNGENKSFEEIAHDAKKKFCADPNFSADSTDYLLKNGIIAKNPQFDGKPTSLEYIQGTNGCDFCKKISEKK